MSLWGFPLNFTVLLLLAFEKSRAPLLSNCLLTGFSRNHKVGSSATAILHTSQKPTCCIRAGDDHFFITTSCWSSMKSPSPSLSSPHSTKNTKRMGSHLGLGTEDSGAPVTSNWSMECSPYCLQIWILQNGLKNIKTALFQIKVEKSKSSVQLANCSYFNSSPSLDNDYNRKKMYT